MLTSSVFFEEMEWSLKVVQRSLKICKFSLKQLLNALSFTNVKISGLPKLLNSLSSQTLKNTVVKHDLNLFNDNDLGLALKKAVLH